MSSRITPGAVYLGNDRCRFTVWAPKADRVAVRLLTPQERSIRLERGEGGYHYGEAAGVAPGSRYLYILNDGLERPDPASRYQPEGVHGPSQLVDPRPFPWTDGGWFGPALPELIFYELHVGTFTPEGTFEAVVPHLAALRELGVTAVELMPVAQFPGGRNWGYDGVYPFAVQNTYGGPDGLRRLVDACHAHGLAVFLDVVYNHLGPEGNYLADFGPYFTQRYRTPWGYAVNFDGPDSDEVRRYFIENALYWVTDFHMDGLRLDAVHAITDKSALPFLEELTATVHRRAERLGRRIHVIAESDLNDDRLIRPRVLGGFGMDAQWNDDFHHALHSLLTGEQDGYYEDYGRLEQLARAYRSGFVYNGEYSSYRQRRHGRRTNCPARRFVVYAQNHDQVGNRPYGKRLSALTSFEGLKAAAAAVLFSPYLPLLFMGEEYGETAPFLYFTSHTDPQLIGAVREGRKEEFEFDSAKWIPNPQAEETFRQSRLKLDLRDEGHHRILWKYYRELIALRRRIPALADLDRDRIEVTSYDVEQVLFIRRWTDDDEVCLALSFSEDRVAVDLPVPAGHWRKRLDSADERWLGDGAIVPEAVLSDGLVRLSLRARSCLLLQRMEEA